MGSNLDAVPMVYIATKREKDRERREDNKNMTDLSQVGPVVALSKAGSNAVRATAAGVGRDGGSGKCRAEGMRRSLSTAGSDLDAIGCVLNTDGLSSSLA